LPMVSRMLLYHIKLHILLTLKVIISELQKRINSRNLFAYV
jgi:hypothetical protein